MRIMRPALGFSWGWQIADACFTQEQSSNNTSAADADDEANTAHIAPAP
jgi:hypothetical protein